MRNRKGFTLVELLVVITIIGIITVLALPSVQQLQARNRNKKFEAYGDSIESAGKLYTDSYADDMFGMSGNGCYDIPYSELRGKSLIKDYEIDGVSCNSDKTFVQVIKENNKYSYSTSLYCTKNGEVIYESVISSCSDNGLTITDEPTVTISYTNKGNISSSDWSTAKDITIKVSAVDGLIDNISIQYGWSMDPNVRPTAMTTYNYRNDYGTASATMTFEDAGKNGEYYLFVEGDDVIDIGGRVADDKWSAVMKFDNMAPNVPVLDNPRDNVWTGLEFVNAGSYVIGVSSSDPAPGSGIAYYQYRYPNSENVWHTYENSAGDSFTTTPFTVQRDEDVEISACDYANNCSSPSSSRIRIDMIRPEVYISLTGTEGNTGWYISKVSVKLTTDDTGGSGVSGYDLTTSTSATYGGTASATQNTAVSGVIWYGYVKDGAGNTASTMTSSFKVDSTVPTLSFSLSGTTSTATCADPDSGVVTSTFTKTLTGSSVTHSVTCVNKAGAVTSGSQNYVWDSCATGSPNTCVGGYATCTTSATPSGASGTCECKGASTGQGTPWETGVCDTSGCSCPSGMSVYSSSCSVTYSCSVGTVSGSSCKYSCWKDCYTTVNDCAGGYVKS